MEHVSKHVFPLLPSTVNIQVFAARPVCPDRNEVFPTRNMYAEKFPPTDYFKLYRIPLTLLGVWPLSSSGVSSVIHSIYAGINMMFCGFVFTLSEFINLFYVYDDIDAFSFNLTFVIAHLMACLKFVPFLITENSLPKICSIFETDIISGRSTGSDAEVSILWRSVKRINSWFFVYLILGIGSLVIAIVAPFFQRGDNATFIFPCHSYLPYDVRSPIIYGFTFAYEVASMCYLAVSFIHCDMLFLALAMHCCCQFELLSYALRTIKERAARNVANEFRHGNSCDAKGSIADADLFLRTEVAKEVVRLGAACVKHHYAILKIAKQLDEVYNLLVLAQFVTHLVEICFQLLLLTQISIASVKGVFLLGFLTGMIYEIFIYCYCGSCIEHESTRISVAAYDAQWTSFSTSAKRTLSLIMLRAQHPVQFTLGKFTKLSLATFLAVMQGSMSYFMVMRSRQ